MGIAESIRNFWDDLFYSELVQRLEQDLILLRSDMQQLRLDKDSVIADLRAEKSLLQAENLLYKQNINARVGIDPTRKRADKPSFASFTSPPAKTSWQAEVEAHDAQIAKELEEEAAASSK